VPSPINVTESAPLRQPEQKQETQTGSLQSRIVTMINKEAKVESKTDLIYRKSEIHRRSTGCESYIAHLSSKLEGFQYDELIGMFSNRHDRRQTMSCEKFSLLSEQRGYYRRRVREYSVKNDIVDQKLKRINTHLFSLFYKENNTDLDRPSGVSTQIVRDSP